MAHRPRRIVVGADGSPHSRRAVAVVARLAPARGGSVTCVRVIEPARLPSMPLVPASLRARIASGAAARAARANLLVVGSRGAGALRHFLLGSVADGALKRAPVSVLVAR